MVPRVSRVTGAVGSGPSVALWLGQYRTSTVPYKRVRIRSYYFREGKLLTPVTAHRPHPSVQLGAGANVADVGQ